MGWRSWIPKREKYDIEGREVLIVNKTSIDFSQLREVILLVCKTERMAWHFPKLTFVIKDIGELMNAFISDKDLLRKKTIITINGSEASKENPFYNKEWQGTITHELTHLYHNRLTKAITNSISTQRKLVRSLQKEKFADLKYTVKKITAIRILTFRLVRQILIEGVAVYSKKLKLEEVIFSDDTFKEEYEAEAKDTRKLKTDFINLLSGPIWKDLSIERGYHVVLFSLSTMVKHYTTGYHMVYTILYVDHDTTFEDILLFQPFEFIKKYEACMKIKGLQPVISATSGDGIFDYKNVLATLTAAAKKGGV